MSASGSADQLGSDVSRMPPRIISLANIATNLQKNSKQRQAGERRATEQQGFRSSDLDAIRSLRTIPQRRIADHQDDRELVIKINGMMLSAVIKIALAIAITAPVAEVEKGR